MRLISLIYILVFSFFLSLHYSQNIFGYNNNAYHENFQKDSESIILGKLTELKEGRNGSHLNFPCKPKNDELENFYNNYPSSSCKHTYNGNFGIQYIIFHPISLILDSFGVVGQSHIDILRTVSAFLTSLMILFIAFFIKKRHGLFSSLLFTVPLITTPSFVAMAANLYWAPWLWMLPILYTLYTIDNPHKIKNGMITSLLLIFNFLHGFEYITNILLTIALLFIIYSPKISLYKTLGESIVKTGILAIVSIATTIGIHIVLLGIQIGSIKKAGNDFWGRVAKRTYDASRETNPIIEKSVEASKIKVIFQQMNTDVFLNINLAQYLFFFTIIFLIGFYLSGIKNIRYPLVAILALFSTFSWHVLASPHSYIHQSINAVLVVLPLLPILHVTAFLMIRQIKKTN